MDEEKKEFGVIYSGSGNYFLFSARYHCYLNREFATLCGVTEEEYKTIMIEKFNGILDAKNNDEVEFHNIEEIRNAAEWIRSRAMIKKLAGEEL